MQMLSSQLNPHFLFNTLNIIACMAKLEDAYTTEKMITSMSNLFRYNLKTTEQIVPLNQELKVVQDYTYIQKMRFGSRIRYDCRIEVDGSAVSIPAFTLQPLVENAIEHGLVDEMDDWWIQIEAEKHQEKLMIRVENPGVKVCKEELERIRQQLSYEKFQEGQTQKNWMKQNQSIGLENIQRRIQLMYGRAYGLEIDARQQGGLCVTLRLPLKAEEDRCILI